MKKLNVLYLTLFLCISVSAQQTLPLAGTRETLLTSQEPGLVTVKKCADFQITGNGSNAAWSSTEWIKMVQQGSDITGYETKAKVLYSGTGIYFLFSCEDVKLTSTMAADYLNLWEEDVVEAFLWTSEDFPVYFEYEISPMNYELPIIIPNNRGKFLGWLPWKYEGDRKIIHGTSTWGGEKKSGGAVLGWMAEFFIPYKLLNPLPQVPPGSGTKWRANMYRMDYDKGTARWAWQKTAKSFHEYNSFGTFLFE